MGRIGDLPPDMMRLLQRQLSWRTSSSLGAAVPETRRYANPKYARMSRKAREAAEALVAKKRAVLRAVTSAVHAASTKGSRAFELDRRFPTGVRMTLYHERDSLFRVILTWDSLLDKHDVLLWFFDTRRRVAGPKRSSLAADQPGDKLVRHAFESNGFAYTDSFQRRDDAMGYGTV